MGRPKYYPGRLMLFLALNLADFSLTWFLLEGSRGHVAEGNPVASWCLENGGWEALAVLKAVSTLLVAAIALALGRRHPRLRARVLNLGCTVLAIVVLYSCSLGAEAGTGDDRQAVNGIRDGRELERRAAHLRGYCDLRACLADSLIHGHCSLRQAAEQLARTANGQDPRWLELVQHRFHGLTARQCLAADLAAHAVDSVRKDQPRADRLVRRLQAEFRTAFAVELPLQEGSSR
jgi:hypothetical protein